MPFPPTGLPVGLQARLTDFATNRDFAGLYRGYHWKKDTWRDGFPKILELEERITTAAKSGLLMEADVRSVAKWGNLRSPARVKCHEPVALPLYEGSRPNQEIENDPLMPLTMLLRAKRQGNIQGLGPTYLSKLLRLALPSEFGALHTRILRVVGVGDRDSKQHDWLSLRVRNDGYGWYVPAYQSEWPREYSAWINILRFLGHLLNSSGKLCPHPEGFVTGNLRIQGIWACADVEMALFSYASKCLEEKE